MTQVTCPGTVVTTSTGEPQCVDQTNAPIAWTSQPAFAVQNLDAAMLSGAFGAGFFVMAMGWVVSRGVRVVIDMLR
jgi:hypothetical protein